MRRDYIHTMGGWNILLIIGISMISNGCLWYSLSGSALSSKCKTFTIKEVTSSVTKGPYNMVTKLEDTLKNDLEARTGLREAKTDGDIQFSIEITKYDSSFVAGNDKAKISIAVRVTYKNKYDKDNNLDDKEISKDIEVGADEINNDDSNSEKLFTEILGEIYSQTICTW